MYPVTKFCDPEAANTDPSYIYSFVVQGPPYIYVALTCIQGVQGYSLVLYTKGGHQH